MKINFLYQSIIWSGKSFPCSAGLLLCFLQVIVILLQHTCAATNKQNCASSCGKITNISHPFRLKDDPEICGDRKYELVCENNVTVLSLFSGKYYVQAINYRNYTIRLVDPAIQEDDCSSIPRNFLFASNFTNPYGGINNDDDMDPYQARRDGNFMFHHVIYMNCSNPVRDDPVYVATAPCVNWHSPGHVYAVAGNLTVENLKGDCRVKLVSPTSIFSFYRYGYGYDYDYLEKFNQNFTYAEIHRMLAFGFQVSWMRRACEDLCSSSYCILGEITETVWDSPLGFSVSCEENPSKLRIYVEDVITGLITGLLQFTAVIRDSTSEYGIYNFAYGFEIGRVTGKYVLPTYTIIRILVLLVIIAKLIHTCWTRHRSMYENIEDFLQGNSLVPIRYSYKEIKKMTKGFKDKLGEGGYGTVYKGKLRSGPLVAIKMLSKHKANGEEFINEVATIGRIHHANVVRLIGFCFEGSKRALVYDFMSNGSLDRYISSKEDNISLTYQQMYEASLGVAHGISYLHQGCDMQILHFDIKPHNILLDENFTPKVSDFGLAKLYAIDNSIVTLTAARGTIGYMAPELFYKNIGGVSHKADVYSFGMLLMEMANRRRNLNPLADHSSQIFIPFWVYNQLIEENEIEMGEVTNEEKKNVKKMFMVALWCIQLKPSHRPSMNKVIEMLEGDVESIQMPPKPSLYPTEMFQGDSEIKSDESITNDASSSICFLEETTKHPLLQYSS